MRGPSEFLDGIVVALEDGQGTLSRGAGVECADQGIHAGGSEDVLAVFVPVVGECFGGVGG